MIYNEVRRYGALFLCSIFINMNKLFAFILGYVSIIGLGLYSLYEFLKRDKHGRKSKNKHSK